MRVLKWCRLWLAAVQLSGCAFWSAQTYNVNDFALDLAPGHGRFIEAKSSPRWAVWDVPAKAWLLNIDGRIEFFPLTYSGDFFQEFSGPLSGVMSHVTTTVP